MGSPRSFEVRDSGVVSIGTVSQDVVFDGVERWRRAVLFVVGGSRHKVTAGVVGAGGLVQATFPSFAAPEGVQNRRPFEFPLAGGRFFLTVERVEGVAADFEARVLFDDGEARPWGSQEILRADFRVAANSTLQLAGRFRLHGYRQIAFWGRASVQVEMFFRGHGQFALDRDRSINVFNAGVLEVGLTDAVESDPFIRITNADLAVASDVELVLKGIV